MTRDKIEKMLKDNVCKVEFTKINGDKRLMTCTLMEDHLPPAKKADPLSQKKIRAINPEVLSVWDIERKDWRGFRVANVIEVKEDASSQ